jgi:hypothetical protein
MHLRPENVEADPTQRKTEAGRGFGRDTGLAPESSRRERLGGVGVFVGWVMVYGLVRTTAGASVLGTILAADQKGGSVIAELQPRPATLFVG